MQAIKLFGEAEDLIKDLVSAIVYVNDKHVIYEADSKAQANEAVARLIGFDAYTIFKDDRWFVSVPL